MYFLLMAFWQSANIIQHWQFQTTLKSSCATVNIPCDLVGLMLDATGLVMSLIVLG